MAHFSRRPDPAAAVVSRLGLGLGLVWDAVAEAIGLRLGAGAAAGVGVERRRLFLRDGRPGISLGILRSPLAVVKVVFFHLDFRIGSSSVAYGPDG
jgi:hypothetical protein